MTKRIAVLTACALLAFPALAGAKIVVNRSIAGISLTTPKARVHARFGNPDKVFAPSAKTQGQTQWAYFGRSLLVGFKGGKVVEVFTESHSQRTGSGVGPGSTMAAVKARIRGVVCQHVNGFSGQECLTVSHHGATDWDTDFHVTPAGRVKSVLVSILPAGGAVDRALATHL